VEKKNGKIRTCIDYRPLNQAIEDYDWPLPRLQDIRFKVQGHTWFTRFDLRDAFFNLFIAPRDRGATAFWTPWGPYQFCRMPFGLKTAPSYFQRFMDKLLWRERDYVIIYMDDILVLARSRVELMQRERQVLKTLAEAQVEVAKDKSESQKKEITFCGIVLSSTGLSVSPIISKLDDYRVPYTLKDRQSFLGFANYFREFVINFSVLSEPLQPNHLNIARSEKYEEDFDTLVRACLSHVSLSHFRSDIESSLFTDASLYAAGAVLIQNAKIIAVWSGKFSPAQTRYSATDREHLALLLAVEKFKVFTQSEKSLRLRTDHQALLNRSDDRLTPRQCRWKHRILACVGKVEWVPGLQNPADFWSRQGTKIILGGPISGI